MDVTATKHYSHMNATANKRYYYRTLQHTKAPPTNIDVCSVFLINFLFSLSRLALSIGGHLMNQVSIFISGQTSVMAVIYPILLSRITH